MSSNALGRSLPLSLLAVPFFAACVGSPGSRDVSCRPLGSAASQPTGGSGAAPSSSPTAAPFQGSVFTIVMENKSESDIIGSSAAPYINSLLKQGALAAGYSDAFVHPSEPNYLWMVAGENFGILDDSDPSSHSVACTSHIGDQLDMAGLSWKAYEESMGAPCGVTSAYPYAAKHDPFVFFDDLNGWDGSSFHPTARCRANVVDYSQLDADLASGNVPRYVFITPNLLDDMHDGSVQQGDAWLSHQVPKILASPAYKNGGVLFLTWDEGSSSGDYPPMIVLSPYAKAGYVSKVSYDTSAYLKTVEAILGLQPLPCDPTPSQVPVMSDLFSVPLPAAQ